MKDEWIEQKAAQENGENISTGGLVNKIKRVIITTDMNELAPILEVTTQLCVVPLNEEDLQTIEDLKEILIEKEDAACGIAAPQIGIPRQIFVMRDRRNVIRVFVNPVIIRRSQDQNEKPEGCLSVNNFFPRIKRSKSITIRWYSHACDHEVEQVFENMDARIIQHELDHLNGRLIIYHGLKNLEKQHQYKQSIIQNRNKLRAKRKAKNKNGR